MNFGPTRFKFGQLFVNNTLIYTVLDASGEVRLFEGADRSIVTLAELKSKYRSLDTCGVDIGLGRHAAVRWSPSSMKNFADGAAFLTARELWASVASFFARHFQTSQDVVDVVATYILGTHVYDAVDTVPYLGLVGPPGTGKSLVGELITALAFNGRHAYSITPAGLYLLVDQTDCTLVLDEHGKPDRETRRMLLAGHQRAGTHTNGRRYPILQYRCFGPKVIITNDELNDEPLESRLISLYFRQSGTASNRFSPQAVARELEGLRDSLHAFGMRYAAEVRAAYETIRPSEELRGRSWDVGALLIAVANVVDADSAGTGTLQDRLERFLRKTAAERGKVASCHGEDARLARLVVQFLDEESSRTDRPFLAVPGDQSDWHLAPDFALFLRRQADPLRTRDVVQAGKLLHRYSFVAEQKVVRVTPSKGGPIDDDAKQIQRVAYRFDHARVAALSGVDNV